MPDVKAFRSSLERIKSSSSRMSVKGGTDGTISFSTENYTVVSTVKFSSLRVFTSGKIFTLNLSPGVTVSVSLVNE